MRTDFGNDDPAEFRQGQGLRRLIDGRSCAVVSARLANKTYGLWVVTVRWDDDQELLTMPFGEFRRNFSRAESV